MKEFPEFFTTMRIQNFSENTLSSYKTTYRQLLSHCRSFFALELDETTITQLTKPMVLSFLNQLRIEGKSPATIHNRAMAIKSLLLHYHISFAHEIMGVQLPQRKPVAYTLDEIQTIQNQMAIQDKKTYLRDRALFVLYYSTGARLSEIAKATIADIDGQQLHIIGKGNKERYVPIVDSAYTLLQSYLQTRKKRTPDAPLFAVCKEEKPISKRSIQSILYKYEKAAGMEHTGVHILRHTFGTSVYTGGADVLLIQELMGHARLETTKRYITISEETKRKAITTGYSTIDM